MKLHILLYFLIGLNFINVSYSVVPLTPAQQEALNRQLLLAVITRQSVQDVAQLIQQGADVNYKNPQSQQTPLNAAAFLGNLPMVRLLVERGAHVDGISMWGLTPLLTIMHPKEQYVPIVQYLLEHGANPNYRSAPDGPTPLAIALNLKRYSLPMTRYLLAAGANPHSLNVSDLAAISKNIDRLEIFRLLLRAGLPFDVTSKKYQTLLPQALPQPLLQAIILHDASQVKGLLDSGYGHEITKDSDGISALVYAAGQANEQILSLLFKYEAYQYDTAGIEEAIEVVASRLRGLDQKSPPYQKYERILKGLSDQLSYVQKQHINMLLKGLAQQDPAFDLTRIPAELLEQIMREMFDRHGSVVGKIVI
jgi:ankyrin repeat protein